MIGCECRPENERHCGYLPEPTMGAGRKDSLFHGENDKASRAETTSMSVIRAAIAVTTARIELYNMVVKSS